MKKPHLSLGCIIIMGSLPFVAISQVTDVEGNTYKTIQFGTQLWTAENLKTTKFNDGTAIPLVTDETWTTITTPGYCWPNNDIDNVNTCGIHYNWYTVNTGKLCPTGWHVPTRAEWALLLEFIGAVKTKESPSGLAGNTGSVKETLMDSMGFNAMTSGFRGPIDGEYAFRTGRGGIWWSSTEASSPQYKLDWAYVYYVFKEARLKNIQLLEQYKRTGLSVRCLKD